jgi:hypothetical protein
MSVVNGVGVQPSHNPYQNVVNPGKGNNNAVPGASNFQNPTDTFTRSVEGAANPGEIRRLWNETDHMANAIRTLVSSALGNANGVGQGFWSNRSVNLQLSEADRATAQQLVSEDGFFGVQQTTDRIMGFAQALVGENASPEQIERMRAAVQKGFDQVARMFGGFNNLPQVTRDTFDAIMERFDQWLPAEVNFEE